MKKFLDLGLQPLANSLLTKKNLRKKEKKFFWQYQDWREKKIFFF